MIGILLSSSIPSMERGVLAGTLLGKGRLMKWITCSLIEAVPTVAFRFGFLLFSANRKKLADFVGKVLRREAGLYHGGAKGFNGFGACGVQKCHAH